MLELEPLLVRVDEAVTVTAEGDERRAFDLPESVSSRESDDSPDRPSARRPRPSPG